jgi:hypothetical protein
VLVSGCCSSEVFGWQLWVTRISMKTPQKLNMLFIILKIRSCMQHFATTLCLRIVGFTGRNLNHAYVKGTRFREPFFFMGSYR